MPKKLLIIDDDPSIREVAKMALELVGGYDVVTAGSGRDGLDLARAERVDAILLDVMMPGLDGPATLAELRADPDVGGLPVVLLTAKVQASERRRFAELPVSGVLTKPFDPVDLSAQVAQLLGWVT